MRLPVRSERDAYRIAWSSVIVIAVCVVVGALIHPWVGIALFVVIAAAALLWDVRAPNPDRVSGLHEAEGSGRKPASSERPRLLVVANQTLPGQELRDELVARGEPKPDLRVVAPILISRVKYAMSDIDTEMVYARERLEDFLRWGTAQGFEVSGEVCPDGPLIAIEDQLRKFPVDEVVISTHPRESSNWLEVGVVEQARDELDTPVTHVVVDLRRAGHPSG
jgi:hypothetical protein